jgi:hypothetical protein
MAVTRYGDLVVSIPLPSGKSNFVKIGSVLESDNNDPAKGLPYMLMLDCWVDLAALHQSGGFPGTAVPVSLYKAKNRDWPPAPAPRPSKGTKLPHPADSDDDIPF